LKYNPSYQSTDGSAAIGAFSKDRLKEVFEPMNTNTNPLYNNYDGEGGKKKRLVGKPLDKCTILELKERAARRRINIKGLKTKAEILAKMRK
jgi:hypothetical protein